MPRLAWGLLVVYAVLLSSQVPVWRSEQTLWAHAVRHAPQKPRPVLNHAKALLLAGRVSEAERGFLRVRALAEQPHIPAYDRIDALQAADGNLQMVPVFRMLLQAE